MDAKTSTSSWNFLQWEFETVKDVPGAQFVYGGWGNKWRLKDFARPEKDLMRPFIRGAKQGQLLHWDSEPSDRSEVQSINGKLLDPMVYPCEASAIRAETMMLVRQVCAEEERTDLRHTMWWSTGYLKDGGVRADDIMRRFASVMEMMDVVTIAAYSGRPEYEARLQLSFQLIRKYSKKPIQVFYNRLDSSDERMAADLRLFNSLGAESVVYWTPNKLPLVSLSTYRMLRAVNQWGGGGTRERH